MTLEEASVFVGAPPIQLLRWACIGVGPKHVGNPISPKSMRYERSDLESWLAERTAKAESARGFVG